MKNYRIIGAVSVALMLSVCLGITAWQNQLQIQAKPTSYNEPLLPAPYEENPTAGINADFTVNEQFSSHFPLVILDMGGKEPPITTRHEGNRYVELDDVEPYVTGTLTVIDNESGLNRLTDTPAAESIMNIKRRGNNSMHYFKPQYLVKLLTSSGQNNDIDLMGMGAEHEWVLNGSMADKSMMRNYMAYRICSEVLEFTPDSHYCEVVTKTEDGYMYQGVYLLIESIKQGENRVDIQDFSPSQPYNSFLLRRDRLDEKDDRLIEIDVPQGSVEPHESWFYCLYPNRYDITQAQKDYIKSIITNIETTLYSDDPKVFCQYPNYIDVDSFVDFFVLMEFFGSYDAGQYSTYFYQDVGGKLKIGPAWDFDGAIDNSRQTAMDIEVTALQAKPWFERLSKDITFLKKVQKRYTKLRQTLLSEENIIEMIDTLQLYIGGAQEREWLRWNDVYTQKNLFSLHDTVDSDGDLIVRETTEYVQEIHHLKSILSKHGDSVPNRLTLLMRSTEFKTGTAQYQGVLLLLAAALFIIPAIFVSYRK